MNTRRGAGLVLALLALVVVTAGLAGGWQAWAALRRTRSAHAESDRLRCLLLAGEELAEGDVVAHDGDEGSL